MMRDIKACSIEELNRLAEEIRQKILQTVSKNGGHLSSTMGATDLIIAMHSVFDVEEDPFIFDKIRQNKWLYFHFIKGDDLGFFQAVTSKKCLKKMSFCRVVPMVIRIAFIS